MYRTVFLLLTTVSLINICAVEVRATTGWDRHEVDLLGKFRLHGKNGASAVHQLDAQGNLIQPALCGNLDANIQDFVLGVPPDYAITETHLVVRYPVMTGEANTPNHFVISIQDASVTGPIVAGELGNVSPSLGNELSWTTPDTAADAFHRFVIIAVILAIVAIVVCVWAVWRWIGKLRQMLVGAPAADG